MPGKSKKQLEKEFNEGFEYLKKFYEREGHFTVQFEYLEDGFPLGRWIKTTRAKYVNNYLPQDRINKFEIFEDWQWQPKKETKQNKFEPFFEALQDYYSEHKNYKIPTDLCDSAGNPILDAISYYRNKNKVGQLNDWRFTKLDSLPDWDWGSTRYGHTSDLKWEKGYQNLLKFIMINGHSEVPQLTVFENYNLGSWTDKQRINYKEGKLPQDRIDRLEKISHWSWSKVSFQKRYLDIYIHVKEFYEKHGYESIPKNLTTPNGIKMEQWVCDQRANYRHNNLSLKRIKMLEEIPYWHWNGKLTHWLRNYEKLKDFQDRFGHVKVSQSYRSKGFHLQKWVAKQRRAYIKDTLLTEQKEKLDLLSDWQEYLKGSKLK